MSNQRQKTVRYSLRPSPQYLFIQYCNTTACQFRRGS
uniref:Uncharacterized protein n=1 Tax=Anguilla anguilla TaxID=7936 RepID=A0A0E9WQP3_ANGAN